jgi:hypothetical protein
MVTPTTGVVTFIGKATGKVYSYSIYLSDSVIFATWATTALAVTGGVNFITAVEDMTLVDISCTTGPTVIFGLVPWVDDGPVPGRFNSLANVINTVQNRRTAPITIASGHKFQIMQV